MNTHTLTHSLDKEKIAKILSIIVVVSGVLVVAGWVFDIVLLKSILPCWAPMKFSSAVIFVLSGIMVYAITESHKKSSGFAQVALPITVLPILLIMGTFLVSFVLNLKLGIEELFIGGEERFAFTVIPGRPSFPTIIAFILVAIIGTIQLFEPARIKLLFFSLGGTLCGIGGLAIIGYMSNIPAFYYYIKNVNSAMSLPSAILFAILGICLILSGQDNK